MNNRHIFSFFLILCLNISTFYAQTNIDDRVTVNGIDFSGKISINHDTKTITRKADGMESTFSFAEVSSVILEGQEYKVQETVNSGYALLTEEVSGNAVFYRDPAKEIYLKTESTDLRKLNLQNITNLRGELLLYFSDCVPVRGKINNLSRIYSNTVIELVEQYNNCNYSEGFVLSEEEIRKMEAEEVDRFNFYIGAGYYSYTLQLNPIGDENPISGLLLNAGIKMSPGFLRSIEDNLFLTANIDYLVEAESLYRTSALGRVKLATYAVKALGGIHYAFNRENAWQPYIGVEGGFLSTIYDLEYREEPDAPRSIDSSVEKLNLIVEPEIGITYELSENSALNLSFSYFLKKKNGFSSSETSSLPMTTEDSGFSTSLRYIFL